MEDNNNSSILFKCKDVYVESFIFFDVGDFLIFLNTMQSYMMEKPYK